MIEALFAALGLRRLVVINGSFEPDLSDLARLEPGLAIRSMAEALALDEPLLSRRGSARWFRRGRPRHSRWTPHSPATAS